MLTFPREVLLRLNQRIDGLDEQEGTKIRDRLLEALAAMVIQSIDEFRTSDIFLYALQNLEGPSNVESDTPTIEGTTNGDNGSSS